jgi:Zn-dependent peptidase ImmA (M78 family)
VNLSEFIRKNDIKCVDGAEFDHSPKFYKMQQFEKTCHTVTAVPFLEPETYIVKKFDIHLTGFIKEKWNKAGVPSKANIGKLDNPARPKTNHQAGTEPSV